MDARQRRLYRHSCAASVWNRTSPNWPRLLKQFALACWTLFGFSGYARVDFRVDPTGAPFIIDVNPNPYLIPGC